MFEISALSCQHISVTLEHPYQETMATVELELAGISDIKCSIYSLNSSYSSFAKKLSKIVQKSASIPITLRTLIKHWDQENASKLAVLDNINYNVQTGTSENNWIKTEFAEPMQTDLDNSSNNMNSMIGNNGGNTLYQGNTGIWGNASDGENGTINKNGTMFSKHNMFDSNDVSFIQQATAGGNMDINFMSFDGKAVKRRRTEDFCKSPKSELTNSADVVVEQSLDHSSSDSNSLGVPMTSSRSMNLSIDGVATSASSVIDNKRLNANLSVDFSATDGKKAIKSSKSYSDCDRLNKSDEANGSRSESSHGEPAKKKARRRDEKLLENSSNLSPSVSITPITTLPSTSSVTSSSSNINSVLTGLEKRPGIEIIPISSAPVQSIKSSITITPINSTSKSSSDKRSLTGSSSNSSSKKSEDRSKVEKKKKRKRDDSPMGPPEKMPLKQDPLTRPVTVSIKTTDGSPISPSGLLKKFSSSPIHSSSSSSTSSSSLSVKGSSSSSVYSKASPKHSPHSSTSNSYSPKHQTLSSPRPNHYSTSSPKHASATGSGKPSMSALKSATNSPNSKSSLSSMSSERTKSYSSSSSSGRDHKDRDRDRDREKDKDREHRERLKYSSGGGSPKIKSSTVKLKQFDLNAAYVPVENFLEATSSQDPNKSSSGQGAKRKSSLSAVIDKLKSKSANEESPPTTPTLPNSSEINISTATSSTSSREKNSSSSISISSIKSNSNSEYMVKHSSDGMKITINKTRTKDTSLSSSSKPQYHHSSGSSSGSGSNSPKTHTGLKPGVNSGPASKKPQNATISSNSTSMSNSSASISISSSSSSKHGSSSSSIKSLIAKSSSSGSLSSSSKQTPASSQNKSIESLHTATSDTHKKEKNRPSTSNRSNNGM